MTFGMFCWHDLYTVQPDAAREFYSNLLGWSYRRFQEEDTPYWVIDTGQGKRGCIYTVPSTPPMWQTYVSVENVAAVVAKTPALGGSVLHGPIDTPDFGVIALIKDSDGALLWVIQREHPTSMQTRPSPGDFAWYSLCCRDTTSAMAFYNELFGWTLGAKQASDVANRGIILNDGTPVATIQRLDELMPQSPHWCIAIAVADVHATRTNAIDLGATHVRPVYPNGTLGLFCSMRDPVGASISFWQPFGSAR